MTAGPGALAGPVPVPGAGVTVTSAEVRVVLVPGALALLPEYASIVDPLAELRAACLAAVRWLSGSVAVLADEQGTRVAAALLEQALDAPDPAVRPQPGVISYLVVGNGSARRGEKAPGHLDERAEGFDARLGTALRAGDLAGVDLGEAEELWARVGGLPMLAALLDGTPARVDYDDDPYGVQYWVMRWEMHR